MDDGLVMGADGKARCFWGGSTPDYVPYHDTDAAGKEMNSLDFMDATTQTVRGAAQYLSRNGAKVGLTGFCLGGAVTIIGATKIPELTAGVVFYGIPPEAAAKPADVRIPLQAHFADKDDWCTPATVDAFVNCFANRAYDITPVSAPAVCSPGLPSRSVSTASTFAASASSRRNASSYRPAVSASSIGNRSSAILALALP